MTLGTALVTGVGRRRGIGASIAVDLARAGWDLAMVHSPDYDRRLGLERGDHDPDDIAQECRDHGRTADVIAADLADPDVAAQVVTAANHRGDLTAVVMSHCESVDSSILDTTVESWDRHYAVNARAVWLLIKAFAENLTPQIGADERARIVALTSDHTAHNLPYGSSKGALDRIVVAAAIELGDRGIRANVVNPGPVDTGWMGDAVRDQCLQQTPAGRLGTPQDIADLVTFLVSPSGGWVTGQVLYTNGGFMTAR